jgi:antibiotic biosynthesis monooxygenase (ABM) superfamily enzyme
MRTGSVVDIPLSAVSETANSAVTLVTQTRVLPEHSDAFAGWQRQMGELAARSPGFVAQSSIPPSPPVQLDWAMVQHFDSADNARAWLQSDDRRRLLVEIQPLLVGSIDVHLFSRNDSGAQPAPVSMLISTQVKAGQEDAFLRWQKRIAAAQAKFEGFRGYRLDPPILGVQNNWVMLVRFDSNAHLDAWLNSEQRRQLLAQTEAFDAGTHLRKVGSGFESWFASKDGDIQAPPPAWKQNALVLLMLYPFIFLFDAWVQRPLLQAKGMPFWLALFIADAVGVPLLGYLLMPQANKLFKWWLNPSGRAGGVSAVAGATLVALLCGAMVVVFAQFP